MTQAGERDKYVFLSDEERVGAERIEKVNFLSLDELEVGDRIGIAARTEPVAGNSRGAFILEVSLKEQLEEGKNGNTKVTFRYYPASFFGFRLYTEHGEARELEHGATIESGFSSVSSHAMSERQPLNPDYNSIRTGESYWFGNAAGTGQLAIARNISEISLLRKINL